MKTVGLSWDEVKNCLAVGFAEKFRYNDMGHAWVLLPNGKIKVDYREGVKRTFEEYERSNPERRNKHLYKLEGRGFV
jgi:hypothetical protein